MSRGRARGCVLGVAAVVGALVGSPASAAQGCTGEAASTGAQSTVPFGTVVSTTAQTVPGNFGQTIISPEARTPHDACG